MPASNATVDTTTVSLLLVNICCEHWTPNFKQTSATVRGLIAAQGFNKFTLPALILLRSTQERHQEMVQYVKDLYGLEPIGRSKHPSDLHVLDPKNKERTQAGGR